MTLSQSFKTQYVISIATSGPCSYVCIPVGAVAPLLVPATHQRAIQTRSREYTMSSPAAGRGNIQKWRENCTTFPRKVCRQTVGSMLSDDCINWKVYRKYHKLKWRRIFPNSYVGMQLVALLFRGTVLPPPNIKNYTVIMELKSPLQSSLKHVIRPCPQTFQSASYFLLLVFSDYRL
jgi:hypothetical protein